MITGILVIICFAFVVFETCSVCYRKLKAHILKRKKRRTTTDSDS